MGARAPRGAASAAAAPVARRAHTAAPMGARAPRGAASAAAAPVARRTNAVSAAQLGARAPRGTAAAAAALVARRSHAAAQLGARASRDAATAAAAPHESLHLPLGQKYDVQIVLDLLGSVKSSGVGVIIELPNIQI